VNRGSASDLGWPLDPMYLCRAADDAVPPRETRVVAAAQRFTTKLVADRARRVFVPVPFDPDDVWGRKTEHHVHGTVGGMGVRGVIEALDEDDRGVVLGPAWRRDCGLAAGDTVDVVLLPEGPQRADLADDLAAALAAEPAAAEFFDSLAQFYRRAYLRYIDATKRRPEVRAERIAEVVELLAAGVKQRPRA
jgi:hypothetical protein